MNIVNVKEPTYTLLSLSGELDALSSIDLDDQIKKTFDSDEPNVLVSLDDLSYISSAGLGVFMSYVKDLETNNKQLILFGLNETVYSTFEILGLHYIIPIVGSKQEAVLRC